MANRVEFDLRWATLFCSFVISYLLREHPIALTIYLIFFSLLIVAYIVRLPRYLDEIESRMRARLLILLEDGKTMEAHRLVTNQKRLRTLGRRYALQNALGIIAMSDGKYHEAQNAFQGALKQAPYGERLSIELNLANVEVALQRADLAVERYRTLMKRYPQSGLVRERMARLMLEEAN